SRLAISGVVKSVARQGLVGSAWDRIVVGRSRYDRTSVLFVRGSAGHSAAHKQQGCGRKHREEGRRLHGHCQLLSILPKRAVWPRAEVAWRLIADGLSVPSAMPPMRRMGSSGPTAQPSVDRRVRRVQRSIGGNEAIVTDVTTSG